VKKLEEYLVDFVEEKTITINEHETNTDSEHKNINKELGRRMTTNQQRLGYKRRLKKGTNQEGAGGTTQTLIR